VFSGFICNLLGLNLSQELSMALEHARRADVDVVLLQRGEAVADGVNEC
jgi:hypothetical protein